MRACIYVCTPMARKSGRAQTLSKGFRGKGENLERLVKRRVKPIEICDNVVKHVNTPACVHYTPRVIEFLEQFCDLHR